MGTQPKKIYTKYFAAGLLLAGVAVYTNSSHGSDKMLNNLPNLQTLANINPVDTAVIAAQAAFDAEKAALDAAQAAFKAAQASLDAAKAAAGTTGGNPTLIIQGRMCRDYSADTKTNLPLT